MNTKRQDGFNHRNFVYVIEKKMNGRWGLEWDFGCYLTYEVAEQVMGDFEKYTKNPKDYRLVMYISEKPHDV
jgi:hypothetical protein